MLGAPYEHRHQDELHVTLPFASGIRSWLVTYILLPDIVMDQLQILRDANHTFREFGNFRFPSLPKKLFVYLQNISSSSIYGIQYDALVPSDPGVG